jgi:hypothetical protein
MAKVFKRTENGTTTYVSLREGLAEINHAMMAGKKDVREMFEGSTGARITYKDGRRVMFLKVDAPAEEKPAIEHGPKVWTGEATRIVTVKGKRYVVGTVRPASTHVHYWSERNGEAFGPTRDTGSSAKPGTVGRAIWDAVNAG